MDRGALLPKVDTHSSRFVRCLSNPGQKRLILLGVDLLGVVVSFLVSYWIIVPSPRWEELSGQGVPILSLFVFFIIISLHLFKAYTPFENRKVEAEFRIILKGMITGFSFLFLVNHVFFGGKAFSTPLLLLWGISSLFILSFIRLILREIYKTLWRNGYLRQRVLVIGLDEEVRDALRECIILRRHTGFEYVGMINEGGGRSNSDNPGGIPILGTFKDVPKIVKECYIDRVIIVPQGLQYNTIAEFLHVCKDMGLSASLMSDVFSPLTQNMIVDELAGLFILQFNRSPLNRKLNKSLKRTLDLMAVSIGLPIAALLYILVSLLIKVEDGGQIIYRRRVVGQSGVEFDAFKFRSMREDADRILEEDLELRKEFEQNFKLRNDPRLTRVGAFIRKYSLDEFPQLINVLKGEMSLVGPRMVVREELKKYGKWAKKLLTVKPGLTGYWQVNGRQTISYDERIRMDMFYIDHWSIWMDIFILLKTPWKMLKGEGAY